MRRLTSSAYVILTAAVAALPVIGASAQVPGAEQAGDVMQPVLWTLGALLISGLILGALYAFKYQLGGFENPEWVAPLGAIYSHELPQDEPVIHGTPTEDATGGAVEPAALDTSHEIQDREAHSVENP